MSRFAPYAPLVLFAVLILLRPVATALFALASFVYGAVGGDSTLASLGQELFFFWQR